MKRKKLVIISHTEHYKDPNGIISGWGPTVNEINFISDSWDEVCHVGCFYNDIPPASSLPYIPTNIKFIPIPPFGGKRIIDKVSILFKIPKIILTVVAAVKGASEVQLRLPTSMGLFLLPLFSFFIPRTFSFWVKYAGNWKQEKAPLSYKLQRWWLQKNIARCKVTINGFWNDQPEHCYSFENPCLTNLDIEEGKRTSLFKFFNNPFVFTFVGRLENAKGVRRIISALKDLPMEKIAAVHFIGDGPEENSYKELAGFLGDKVVFHGFQNRKSVHELLKLSHFLLLPSDSEGFPKVIAEGACYGVLPIVSDVGSIPHYVNSSNGFLWKLKGDINYGSVIGQALNTSPEVLYAMSTSACILAKSFTMTQYKIQLEDKILSSK